MLRWADAPVGTVPSTEVPTTVGRSTTGLATELDMPKAQIVEFESVGTVTVCWHEELLGDVKQCYAEEVSFWKETSFKNVNSLIRDVKVTKADSDKMSVEKILTSARFEEHIRSLQKLVNANAEWKVSLTDAMAKTRELLKSPRSIDVLGYSV